MSEILNNVKIESPLESSLFENEVVDYLTEYVASDIQHSKASLNSENAIHTGFQWDEAMNNKESFEDESDEIYEDKNEEENDTEKNNFFEIIEDLNKDIVEDEIIEEFKKTIQESHKEDKKPSPVKCEVKKTEMINVVLEICFDVDHNHKYVNIFDILDESSTKSNKEELEDNLENHTEIDELLIEMPSQTEELMCLICVKYFDNKTTLRIHNLLHSNEQQNVHQCTKCKKKFDSPEKLKNHVHKEYKFVCKICSRKCSTSMTLKQHMKTHSNERKFSCIVCQFKSKTNASLKLHMQTHSNERKFKCEFCNYATNRGDNYKGHFQNMHLNPKVKKFKTL